MTSRNDSLWLRALLLIALSVCWGACHPSTGPSSAGPTLRVINVGPHNLEGLVVAFPSERVAFGDVAPGSTTPYRLFRNGVFRYAAYEFRADGRVQRQPVIDWVGEEPMEGQAFTYSVELVEEGPPSGLSIRLVAVQRDY